MKGVLLVNLGSPDSTSVKDVRRYLNEFLMDERVIDLPYIWRFILVRCIIAVFRPRKSAAAYKKIWWKEGSPLIVLSWKLINKVSKKIKIASALSMRYGKPSIFEGINQLHLQGVTELLIIPMYPQYAMATTETIQVLAEKIIKDSFPHIGFQFLPPFYNSKAYIDILSDSIVKQLKVHKPEYLLFSYHGVPERHIRKSDITQTHCKIDHSCCTTPSKAHQFCYRHQCYETTRLVAKKLDLDASFYGTSFQSRLGKDPWLMPFTDKTIDELPKKGVKKLAVVTPAFVSDCLETLEEIGMEAKDAFKENGGEEFVMIPCLNDTTPWVDLLAQWINDWSENRLNK